MAYKEINGDLIQLALMGTFDVISHGCNCYCTQGAGIALTMKNTFGTDKFRMEQGSFKGDYNKLGTIDYRHFHLFEGKLVGDGLKGDLVEGYQNLTVVNSYTQHSYGKGPGGQIPLDYDALRLCLRKINRIFKGLKVGLPMIGCHLAGGDWNVVKKLIETELKDCDTTVVIWDK